MVIGVIMNRIPDSRFEEGWRWKEGSVSRSPFKTLLPWCEMVHFQNVGHVRTKSLQKDTDYKKTHL